MIGIFSPIKNEYRLKEWILYYHKLSIDFFILYDDFSENNIDDYFKELNIKNYYIYKHNKEIWDRKKLKRNNNKCYPRTDFIKDKLINICHQNNIKYLMMFDADEFLYLNKFNNIKQMINFYQPFDILHVNWLIFYKNIKKNNSNSLIKIYDKSNESLNQYTKPIINVSKLINGINAHTVLLKENSIQKNIKNQIIPPIVNHKHEINYKHEINLKYKDANLFLAHYVFKDITSFVDKKLINIDGNFENIFMDIISEIKNEKKKYKKKKEIIDFHKKNKEIIINYIFDLIENKNISDYENQLPKLEIYKQNYLRYYFLSYGHEKKYYENKLIINYLYD